MAADPKTLTDELRSIARRADQQSSIHARLRDRYGLYAATLDYGTLAVSTYLVSLLFVEPTIGLKLSFGVPTSLWVGCLSLASFFFSVVQFKSDWKNKTQAHRRSCAEYALVKGDCRALLSKDRPVTGTEFQRLRDKYELVAELGTHIPDRHFLSGKAHHLRKVFISRYLDRNPGAWVPWVTIRLMFRDTFNPLSGSNDVASK